MVKARVRGVRGQWGYTLICSLRGVVLEEMVGRGWRSKLFGPR